MVGGRKLENKINKINKCESVQWSHGCKHAVCISSAEPFDTQDNFVKPPEKNNFIYSLVI